MVKWSGDRLTEVINNLPLCCCPAVIVTLRRRVFVIVGVASAAAAATRPQGESGARVGPARPAQVHRGRSACDASQAAPRRRRSHLGWWCWRRQWRRRRRRRRWWRRWDAARRQDDWFFQQDIFSASDDCRIRVVIIRQRQRRFRASNAAGLSRTRGRLPRFGNSPSGGPKLTQRLYDTTPG